MSVKILIIDDDISIGNLEQEILEQTGYQVLRAYLRHRGSIAFEKLSSRSDFT